MWDKFGEFDSYEELNRAAAAQKKEGDEEALFALAQEPEKPNGQNQKKEVKNEPKKTKETSGGEAAEPVERKESDHLPGEPEDCSGETKQQDIETVEGEVVEVVDEEKQLCNGAILLADNICLMLTEWRDTGMRLSKLMDIEKWIKELSEAVEELKKRKEE